MKFRREAQPVKHIQLGEFIAFAQEVSSMEERTENFAQPQEITAAIHHAQDGPSLESCLVSILSAHLSSAAI